MGRFQPYGAVDRRARRRRDRLDGAPRSAGGPSSLQPSFCRRANARPVLWGPPSARFGAAFAQPRSPRRGALSSLGRAGALQPVPREAASPLAHPVLPTGRGAGARTPDTQAPKGGGHDGRLGPRCAALSGPRHILEAVPWRRRSAWPACARLNWSEPPVMEAGWLPALLRASDPEPTRRDASALAA